MKYKNQQITINVQQVKQVTRTAAEKAYNEGKTIYLHPCNLLLNNMWQTPLKTDNKDNESFKNLCFDFIYYNCDSERGYYPNFFVEI